MSCSSATTSHAGSSQASSGSGSLPKRHIPVEGNVDQVSNPVLENNMAKKKKKYIHINLHVIWRSFDDV